MRSRMRAGPSVHKMLTALGLQRPAPAARVSAAWLAAESAANMARGMPPWAQLVLDSAKAALVTTVTLYLALNSRAAMRPAMPEPTTKMCCVFDMFSLVSGDAAAA